MDTPSLQHRFSLLRVAVVAQGITAGFAMWFMCYSTRLSCAMSDAVGLAAFQAHTITAILLLVATLIARKRHLMVIPFLSWVLVSFLTPMFAH